MMINKFEVFNENTCEVMIVDSEWLEGVNLKNVSEMSFSNMKNGVLFVTYNDGNKVSYDNVHGSWGFPTRLNF